MSELSLNKFDPDKPFNQLPTLPPKVNLETVPVLKKVTSARAALAELKGIAGIIPNQNILINTISLKESKDSSEIENIITTNDKLFKALSSPDCIQPETLLTVLTLTMQYSLRPQNSPLSAILLFIRIKGI